MEILPDTATDRACLPRILGVNANTYKIHSRPTDVELCNLAAEVPDKDVTTQQKRHHKFPHDAFPVF